MMLFLDFDGVLHALFKVDDARGFAEAYGQDFCHAPLLAVLLRPYLDQLEIVISSTWGHTHELVALKAMLPAEIAARTTDAVHHHLPRSGVAAMECDLDSRYAEISYYLRTCRPDVGSNWLALDDYDWEWPADHRHHLVWAEHDLGCPDTQHRLLVALAARLTPSTTFQ